MAKKRFYGDAVISGASALSVQMPGTPNAQYTVPADGIPVTFGDIKNGGVGSTFSGNLLPDCDAARIASIIVPAGVHAIIDFVDGRQFRCYCADKPVKVKPSMLAPAHAWRDITDTTVLFKYLLCDENGTPYFGNASTTLTKYYGKAVGLQVNVAVRSH